MIFGKTGFNDKLNESRPTTARSITASEQGSRVSLRSLFTTKKIHPVIADVVYGTGEPGDSRPVRQMLKPANLTKDVVDKEEVPDKRCIVRFFKRLKKEWAAKRGEDLNKDPEFVIKKTLRNLFTYIVFLILLMIISVGMVTANVYYFTTAMNDNIANYKFADGSGSLGSIGCIGDFWKYVELPLMQTLFWNVWYNTNINGTLTNEDLVYYDNKLIGVPRMRLLRVMPNSCQIPLIFKSQSSGCYGQYSKAVSDKTPFGPANDTAWIYSQNGSSYSYSGELGTYESGGFMQSLTRNMTSSLSIIDNLKQNLWLNRSARVVFIDFTLYNANIDLFCIVKLIFEFPSTGGAISKSVLRTVKVNRYVSSFDYFVMCCEVVFVLFIIYYILEEVLEIRKQGIKYFVQLWNIVDIFVVMISCSSIGLNLFRCALTNSRLDILLTVKEEYLDFDFASYWQKVYNEVICINLFLAWIKIFKYISFNKTMTQLTDTLSEAVTEIIGFVVMFLIIFFAYAQFAYLSFSSSIADYRRFDESIFTIFRIILADFGFYDIYNANTVIGPIFFISYIFFVFFVLLTMFLAIIHESFLEVKEKINNIKDTFHISQYLKNQILSRLRKDKIMKIQEVLEKGDIMNVEELSFEAWRKELQKHGYADVEIQALFMKYDTDGDRILDYDERNKMLQDIKERRVNMSDLNANGHDEDETENKEERDYVTDERMRELKAKINVVETGLSDIIQKIDRVLELLANSEHAKILHQKNVRYSLAILKSSTPNMVT